MQDDAGQTIEVFIHLDMVGRNGWTGDPDERPLTDLGQRQAQYLAKSLSTTPVHALYASPNLRCRQSIGSLASAVRLPVQDALGFQDRLDSRSQAADQGPDVFANVYLAATAYADLTRIVAALPQGGRAVVCSNGGDIAPALATFVAGLGAGEMPVRPKRSGPGGVERGGIYILRLFGDETSVTYRPPPDDFPA